MYTLQWETDRVTRKCSLALSRDRLQPHPSLPRSARGLRNTNNWDPGSIRTDAWRAMENGAGSKGLTKHKKYDWKDSNLALFGSDTERTVKKDSADQEPAWRKAGKVVGLQIWRIVNFKVKEWQKEEYGRFYNGDSYIILNTYKKDDSKDLQYDVHFWIGKYSTQDEYGTAAYKTVELDTYLDDVPIQHREVQDHESELFRSYFKTLTIMEGGADSGFRQVRPEEYQPRLLHFHGDRKGIIVNEVGRCRSNLDNSDVYILDKGLTLYQWNGSGSNKDERMKALMYLKDLQQERGGKCQTICLDEGCEDDEFYAQLSDEANDDDEDETDNGPADHIKELYRLSDASGELQLTKEKQGEVKMEDFDTKDVFILDTKDEVFVWIGQHTSKTETMNALIYAHNFLKRCDHPLVPVTCLKEGTQSRAFTVALTA